MIENFKVSICMITYNHEAYIAQAIEGVLMQKTNFNFQLIIGDDCSTDDTRNICLDYKKKYPNKIILRLPEKNLGCEQNFVKNLDACANGFKYTAICEGDDYWIDASKLQKQVDVLESNENLGIVYTDSKIFNQQTLTFENKIPRFFEEKNELIAEILKTNYIEFASVLFRNKILSELLQNVLLNDFKGNTVLDTRIILEFAQKSAIGYLPILTSVYRRAMGSVSRPNNIDKFIVVTKEAYQLRRDFVKKYNYKTNLLAIPICNYNRLLIFKAFDANNYLVVLKLLSNFKFFDLFLFADFVTLRNKFGFKTILKIALSAIGIRALFLTIKK